MYTTQKGRSRGKSYTIDGKNNAKEALGFLKDWSTSLVQLDLAAIGAIGIFVGFTDFARSPVLGIGYLSGLARIAAVVELICIGLSALSFFISLLFGQLLLNALPGAVQRIPADQKAELSDVFSIANAGNFLPLDTTSRWLRIWFWIGAGLFALFTLLALARVTLAGDFGPCGD
jgi:hypothetical protein